MLFKVIIVTLQRDWKILNSYPDFEITTVSDSYLHPPNLDFKLVNRKSMINWECLFIKKHNEKLKGFINPKVFILINNND